MSETVAGPTFEVLVERGKIREFAAAMQSENPSYQGPDAVIPPTFLASAALWASPDTRMDHGFERGRVLHGEQEYIFYGPPPRAGAVLFASERLAERYEKQGKRGGVMQFAVVVMEFRDNEGRLVAEGRSTLIQREAPAKQHAGEPASAPADGT
ncbi:MAG: hypothetical protein JWN96_2520 [Mycobacterium sp.]|nr:hypothetical protein [Mycobacterium sp.]